MARPRLYPGASGHLATAQDWRRRQKAKGLCVFCSKRAIWSVRLVRRLVSCEQHRAASAQRQQTRRDRMKAKQAA